MQVYGDHSLRETPRAVLEELRCAAARCTAASPQEPWIVGHARLVAMFIRAGELAQGLADAAFQRDGVDRLTPQNCAVNEAMKRFATLLLRSWDTAEAARPSDLAAVVDLLSPAAREIAGCTILTKKGEGYAFYALYPEAYGMAAQALAGCVSTVIGLRSIGLGLGAVVAARTAAALSVSVRPAGHPFARELMLSEGTRAALAARRDLPFAVVDEGPGLSGSSFGAVAETLERLGAVAGRIHFFPSHTKPPGGAGAPHIVARWHAAPRHVVTFDDLVLRGDDRRHRLDSWVEDLTGRALAPLQEISCGAWRDLKPYTTRPPASPRTDRRKFLLHSARGTFLLRFVGLGQHGESCLRRASALADAGFAPPVLGLRHGFLVERWLQDARPIDPRAHRTRLVARLAQYLAFRARHLPIKSGGADATALLNMARRNIGLAFGDDPDSDRVRALTPFDPATIDGRMQRVVTDNRMHSWEWLQLPEGRLIKTDGYDHCAAHDLVGCQDIAWDAVAAKVEFSMTDREFADLAVRLRAQDVRLDPELAAFYAPCYLAFQIGSLQLDAAATGDPREKSLIRRCLSGYRAALLAGHDFAVFARPSL